jgi:hypothetical protein
MMEEFVNQVVFPADVVDRRSENFPPSAVTLLRKSGAAFQYALIPLPPLVVIVPKGTNLFCCGGNFAS